MSLLTVGYDGTAPDSTLSVGTTVSATKVPVGSAGGLIVYKGHVVFDATNAAQILRVLVYDDDGASSAPGTFLGSGCVGCPAGASTQTIYFPEGVTLPASGNVWLIFAAQGAGIVLERDSTPAVSVGNYFTVSAGASFTAEANNPTMVDQGVTRDFAVSLEADTDQPITGFVGDGVSHTVSPTNSSTRAIRLARIPVTTAMKAEDYARLVWLRANDAFGSTKVRVVIYADDGTGDAGVLPGRFEEADLGSNQAFHGYWDELTFDPALDISAATDYVFVGLEIEGGV